MVSLSSFERWLLPVALATATVAAASEAPAVPPAEAGPLLGRLRRNLASPSADPSRYVYRVRATREDLKGDRVEKVETREYEVRYRDGRPRYRLIARDGKPVPRKPPPRQSERAKARANPAQPRDNSAGLGPGPPRVVVEGTSGSGTYADLLDAFDFREVRRETVDGRPAVLFALTPRENGRPRSSLLSMGYRKMEGEVRVDEADAMISRLALRFREDLKVGGGLAKVGGGTEIVREWRKVNGEIWLPSRTEKRVKARLFGIKTVDFRETQECSEHHPVTTPERADERPARRR